MGKSKQNKRKERPSSSGDDSLPLADIKNKNIDSKRRKEEESKMAECGDGDMNKETLLSTIKEITSDLMKQMDIKLESLSSKDDINQLRCDVNKAFESFKQRVEVAEKDIFDIKEDQAEVKTKIAGIERENKELKEQFLQQSYKLEELNQYGRKNNVKVYNLPERWRGNKGETGNDTMHNVLTLINRDLGLNLDRSQIQIAHRIGERKSGGKERSIIVKFVRREDRDLVIKSRKRLKGKGIVIADDLNPFFASIFYELRQNVGKFNVWSDQGQIFVKLGGSVSKVSYANKDRILMQAREAWENSEGRMDQTTGNRNRNTNANANSPSEIPPSTPISMHNSPNNSVRGFGRGVPLSSSPQNSGGRGRGRGRSSPMNFPC